MKQQQTRAQRPVETPKPQTTTTTQTSRTSPIQDNETNAAVLSAKNALLKKLAEYTKILETSYDFEQQKRMCELIGAAASSLDKLGKLSISKQWKKKKLKLCFYYLNQKKKKISANFWNTPKSTSRIDRLRMKTLLGLFVLLFLSFLDSSIAKQSGSKKNIFFLFFLIVKLINLKWWIWIDCWSIHRDSNWMIIIFLFWNWSFSEIENALVLCYLTYENHSILFTIVSKGVKYDLVMGSFYNTGCNPW